MLLFMLKHAPCHSDCCDFKMLVILNIKGRQLIVKRYNAIIRLKGDNSLYGEVTNSCYMCTIYNITQSKLVTVNTQGR